MIGEVQSVAIIGAGTMGTGIAINAVVHGFPVYLIDEAPSALVRAESAVQNFLNRQVQKGRMTSKEAIEATRLLVAGADLEVAARSDLIIEAVFESKTVKRDVLSKLQPYLNDQTIVATNTSSLLLRDLQDIFENPHQFLGLHFFSPAEINPLVEVVRGDLTEDDVVLRANNWLQSTNRQLVHCRDSCGFVINRFFCPFANEAVRIADEGLGTPAQIDQIAKDAIGAEMGPFAVMNIIKPRIILHAQRNLAPLGPLYTPAAGLVQIGDADESWPTDENGVDADHNDVIHDRLRASLFLPVLQILDERVADPTSIDTGAKVALRFNCPPCGLMDSLGGVEVRKLLEPFCAAYNTAIPKSLKEIRNLVTKSPQQSKE